MPTAQTKIDNNESLRKQLIYGPAKCKKTWWSLKAAEMGFNVILLDAEGGWEIVNQIDAKFRNRIHVVDIMDTSNTDTAALFMVRLLEGRPFLWDEQDKKIIQVTANASAEHSYYAINPSLLSRTDVLVVDSWSAIVGSLYFRYFTEQGIDLYEDFERDNKRGEFGWTGALAHWILQKLAGLSCHVIVIGHETVWEKRKQKIVNGKKEDVVEEVHTQVMSTSGPNARDIARRFSDILRFKRNSVSIEITIEPDPAADAGSRILPPGKHAWKDLQFSNFCKASSAYEPNGTEPCEAFKWLAPGEELDLEKLGLQKPSKLKAIAGAAENKVAQVQIEKPAAPNPPKGNPFKKTK